MLDRSARLLRAALASSLIVVSLPATIAAATEATAQQPIGQNDLGTVLNIAKGYGDAELTKTESGDPVITGTINGTAYQLFFLECKDHRDCGVLDFYSIWNEPDVPLELVNRFNGMRPFNKAYLTEDGFPVVELNVSSIGLTQARLSDIFDRWTITLAEFPREVLDAAAAQ
ncbi:YbjN domain-containing protein [Jiella sp. MQZ9-1]|uniref:YbjN domain-containing protein n=1 Tax=Jiella flava TaxID=2816857 RepID=A0A939FXJ6_9HYPH|nr:YbjN domain-containing protein [Jiella flava]MBO0663833.1 YbjN domain-containing protein [Jiella flava]MCD2472406.1 YbjN domain-containing protein [Jiella flava]